MSANMGPLGLFSKPPQKMVIMIMSSKVFFKTSPWEIENQLFYRQIN